MQICSSCFPKRDTLEKSDINTGVDVKCQEDEATTTFYCCGRVVPEDKSRKKHGMCEALKESSKSDSSVSLAVEALEENVVNITDPAVPFVEDLPEELCQGRTIEVHGKLLENANRLEEILSTQNGKVMCLRKVLCLGLVYSQLNYINKTFSIHKPSQIIILDTLVLKLQHLAHLFSINLSTGKSDKSDLALHFNPRFDRHIIIRNHRIKNKWGVEEITSLQNFPFMAKRNFSVLIFVADEQFLIAVNKIHYCAFAFRIPVEKVKSLIILGDISLNMIQHSDKTAYPPQIFKKTPYIIIPHKIKYNNKKCYFRRKIKEIKTGSCIEIFGRVKILPRAFYINLQKGITVWPHPVVPFHMNYRLYLPRRHKTEKEVIFNSWLDGFWGKEERSTRCPFLPGSPFHVKIMCERNAFNVTVNDKDLYKYQKRSEMDVDSVVIHGDVFVDKVLLH